MKKQSKRVAITKNSIETAYLDILAENPAGKITVKEVCSRSGVNRTTFYKYYKDAADLGEVVRRSMLDEIENLLKETIPADYSDMYEFISQFIARLYRDDRMRRFFVLYREADFREKAEMLTRKYYFMPKYGRQTSENAQIQVAYCYSAFIGLLELWIDRGMTFSPEKISNCIISNSKRILGS